jgi:malonyl CoA-acyl carrier protein transacylase
MNMAFFNLQTPIFQTGCSLYRSLPRAGYKIRPSSYAGHSQGSVHKDLPVKGTNYTASDIADTTSICVWNHQIMGLI